MSNSSHKDIPTHRFMEAGLPFTVTELQDFFPNGSRHKGIPHRHNYYEVFVFTQGGGTHMIDFKEYEIKARSLHFISPGMIHYIKRNSLCLGYVLTFTDELYAMHHYEQILFGINLYHNHQLAPIIEYSSPELEFILQLVHQLKDEYKTNRPMRDSFILSCLNTLLIHANRKFTAQHNLQLSHTFADERVQAFRKWLDEPIQSKPLLSYFAAKINLPAKQLTSIIKKHTGLSPIEHITNRLIIEAKRMLVNTDMSVKEIAFLLYFEDPAYFGRFFRKQTDLTPQQFRTTMRKKYHT